MTVDPNSVDLAALPGEHLEPAEPDQLREMLRAFVQALTSADADTAHRLLLPGTPAEQEAMTPAALTS